MLVPSFTKKWRQNVNQETEKKVTEIGDSNLANAKEAPTQGPVDLGGYTGKERADGILTHEQMLGVGGGREFYEILDGEGHYVTHIAMPVLLRDRPRIIKALKQHAVIMRNVEKLLMPKEGEDETPRNDEEINEKLQGYEDENIGALLTIAFYCFKRCDDSLKDKSEAEGVEILREWMDMSQLQEITRVAMGLNKLNPLAMGALPMLPR